MINKTSDLLELKSSKLLSKFGAGEHIPGSGSAAAYLALISAELIRTVISLTIDPKRKAYNEDAPRFRSYLQKVNEHIYPSLKHLFGEDSIQFGRAMEKRFTRDRESDIYAKCESSLEAKIDLKEAILIPISITEQCIQLATFAEDLFYNGFQSARGDTVVALNSALAGAAGCLSIIDLNLLSLGSDDWTRARVVRASELRVHVDALRVKTDVCAQRLTREVKLREGLASDLEGQLKGIADLKRFSDQELEAIARTVQLTLWNNRDVIWPRKSGMNPIEVLSPSHALKLLGYDFYKSDTLGEFVENGFAYEIAGRIDRRTNTVVLSNRQKRITEKFTAAHELGHAILHKSMVQHRDRPLDGSSSGRRRSLVEVQADKFASYFLMPEKQVELLFFRRFNVDQFELSENSSRALNRDNLKALLSECVDIRGLSRILASSISFNDKDFRSMSEVFDVSVEAMAIRIQELNLISEDLR